MSAAHFIWQADGVPGRRTWRAALLHGTYEIDHNTLTACFIRHPHVLWADGEMMPHRFATLAAAQAYCEQHWYQTVRRRTVAAHHLHPIDPDTTGH